MDTRGERSDHEYNDTWNDSTLSGNDITKQQIRDLYMAGTSDGRGSLKQAKQATVPRGHHLR